MSSPCVLVAPSSALRAALLGSLLALGCARVVPADEPAAPPAVRTEPDPHTASQPAAAVAPPAPAPTPSDVEGLWYLNRDGDRLTLEVVRRDDGGLRGTLSTEGDARAMRIDDVAWDPAQGRVRFHLPWGRGYAWFDARATDGVLAGRIAWTLGAAAPAPTDYRAHVTGWNLTAIDRAPVPRVFDLRWGDGRLGRLRIDRDASGRGIIGSLKVYARVEFGATAEQEERDLSAVRWDGANLAFDVDDDGGGGWHYQGTVTGRTIAGDATPDLAGAPAVPWQGTRAEVLTHGLVARTPGEHAAWSARVRRQLALLTMAGAPSPIATRVETVGHDLAPIASRHPTATSATALPQAYTLTELRVEHDLVSEVEGPVIQRREHLYVARPSAAPPPRGFPVVIAANGHFGSARQMMDPDSLYGYGDAYARRGYVVVAVDVSHRPVVDRATLYADFPTGDDPASGNDAHPAIHAEGLDSGWEEDGERAWDMMRAVDLALSLPGVDPRRVLITGLSMGGEVATVAGALDVRAGSVVVAGFAPDLGVIAHRANHTCWQWTHADIREYLGVSVLHALVAPRLLVVETGLADHTFSDFRAPWASDKQVLRRSRAAWGEQSYRLVHFLHDGAHVYRTGDPSLDPTTLRGISIPVLTAPDADGSPRWQTDGATLLAPTTVFDLTRGAFAR